MYGIRRGNTILGYSHGVKVFLPIHLIRNPVIIYSAIEADNLLQLIMSGTNDYSLIVHRFTDEELEQFTFNKLSGY